MLIPQLTVFLKFLSRPISVFARIPVLLYVDSYETTRRRFRISADRLQLDFRVGSPSYKKVALPRLITNIEVEASASMLMASAVSTALLKEVRASVSVGGGGRGR